MFAAAAAVVQVFVQVELLPSVLLASFNNAHERYYEV